MSEGDRNPLISALPPNTDFLTYLTIVEYNLTKEQLPLLHSLLQDSRLTINIGWDLVHLLLPLLPESERCLEDIACLGNPRETVLKVAELLEEIHPGREAKDEDKDDSSDEEESGGPSEHTQVITLRFHTLTHMLCVLHPRIRTKYPSRFLVTSMQAIVTAYERIAQAPAATTTVLMFVKSISGSRRLHLPPRASEHAIPTVTSRTPASDPEAQPENPSPEEETLMTRLLCYFMTHIMQKYVESLSSVRDSSSLAWTERYFEKRYPERTIPRRKTYRELFKDSEELRLRDSLIAQFLNIADGDLQMKWEHIIPWIIMPATELEYGNSMVATTDYQPSKAGVLYYVAAKAAAYLSNDRGSNVAISLFDDHNRIIESLVKIEKIGTEPASLIDAILILGWAALSTHGGFTEPENNEVFYQYLQRLSLLSAQTPFSSLRYHSHVLSSRILHAHGSSEVRFNYIVDTLEHCSYDNLRVSAVGWLKDEILTAFDVSNGSQMDMEEFRVHNSYKNEINFFTLPSSLTSISSHLFVGPSTRNKEELTTALPYWLAVVNFCYLIYSSLIIYKGLDVARLMARIDVERTFLRDLRDIVESSSDPKNDLSGITRDQSQAELWALEDGLKRVYDAISRRHADSPS